MKTRVVNSLKLLICFLFIFCISQPSFKVSADDLDEPVVLEDDFPYQYVGIAGCSLSISSGTATVTSVVSGNSGTTSISITVYLERYYNGEWHYYMSWSHNGVEQNNLDSTSVVGGIYRVWMSVTATSGGNTESFNVDGNIAGY